MNFDAVTNHVLAHVAHADNQGFTKVMWMNVYRSGFFHREGKPLTVDRHAGDFYETREQAIADIEPRSHYIATVPFVYVDDQDVTANPADSIPTPLAASRRMYPALAEAQEAGRPFSDLGDRYVRELRRRAAQAQVSEAHALAIADWND